ncbi:Zn-ribbon domain-containing OB-fold protein [Henriciella aquimarina]|uniref:Zn-ribbon domain-containing OB-fold protein n=1 Tax=Henriciella aquimarina TaxID=545261 RepID=UPI001301BD70|nr:OB-fold domain-containing protein [Henriciella aquimarina]
MTAEIEALTSGADGPYFEGLKAGEIRVQKCAGCSEIHWPAVFRCPDCGSWEHVWQTVSPEGRIFSWTRTWHAFGGPAAHKPPFVSVVVSLLDADHVRLIGTLDRPDAAVAIGARVRADITEVDFLDRKIPTLIWSLV